MSQSSAVADQWADRFYLLRRRKRGDLMEEWDLSVAFGVGGKETVSHFFSV